jgi:hypothetical protein
MPVSGNREAELLSDASVSARQDCHMPNEDLLTARTYAEQAAATAAKLQPGTYEAVQALALVSIAHSLAVLADVQRTE